MNFQVICERSRALYASLWFILIAVRSMVRSLQLILSGRPRTPLRVLCIVAFDTLHMLRNAKPLPLVRLRTLAALLDCGACANAALDNKDWRRREFRRTLQLLDEAGVRSTVAEYLRRLRDLERGRPAPGGDDRQFYNVVLYRESVVRLSLAILATTAHGAQSLDEAIRATYCDADLHFLFRIVMQCQIMDDVLDYPQDVSAGLPGFLTASTSLRQAFELTRLAALGYADDRNLPRTGDRFPLRSILFLVSTCAKLVIVLGRFRHRYQLERHCTAALSGRRLLPSATSVAK